MRMMPKILTMKSLFTLDNKGTLRERFIIGLIGEKYATINYQGKKYYMPTLPLSKGTKLSHFAVRSASKAERIHNRTAALTKQRLLTKAGF